MKRGSESTHFESSDDIAINSNNELELSQEKLNAFTAQLLMMDELPYAQDPFYDQFAQFLSKAPLNDLAVTAAFKNFYELALKTPRLSNEVKDSILQWFFAKPMGIDWNEDVNIPHPFWSMQSAYTFPLFGIIITRAQEIESPVQAAALDILEKSIDGKIVIDWNRLVTINDYFPQAPLWSMFASMLLPKSIPLFQKLLTDKAWLGNFDFSISIPPKISVIDKLIKRTNIIQAEQHQAFLNLAAQIYFMSKNDIVCKTDEGIEFVRKLEEIAKTVAHKLWLFSKQCEWVDGAVKRELKLTIIAQALKPYLVDLTKEQQELMLAQILDSGRFDYQPSAEEITTECDERKQINLALATKSYLVAAKTATENKPQHYQIVQDVLLALQQQNKIPQHLDAYQRTKIARSVGAIEDDITQETIEKTILEALGQTKVSCLSPFYMMNK